MSSSWDLTYETTSEDERSWSQSSPAESLSFIAKTGIGTDSPVIDIGGGASRLVDELVVRGFRDVTVLDISLAALDEARQRVDDDGVHWIADDVTRWAPSRCYGLWHDRAVFHFLVGSRDQKAYVAAATTGVAAGGHLILATFAPMGPDHCSGLPVQRWSQEGITALFSTSFTFVEGVQIDHVTPWGSPQPFTWVVLQRGRS